MSIFNSRSTDETIAFGKDFAAELSPGDIVALTGSIGAGKTHFIKGIALGLDYEIDVTSPTYNIIHEYHTPEIILYHFDFYRLENANELRNIGFYDYLFGDGICLLEWSDKISEYLPDNIWQVHLLFLNDTERQIKVIGYGKN